MGITRKWNRFTNRWLHTPPSDRRSITLHSHLLAAFRSSSVIISHHLHCHQFHHRNQRDCVSTAILPHSSYPGERFKDVTSVSWSPDGQYLATGCYDGIVRIWDNQGNLITLLKEHTGPVFSLKWTKSGNYILSGSYDRRSIVWDANSGRHHDRKTSIEVTNANLQKRFILIYKKSSNLIDFNY